MNILNKKGISIVEYILLFVIIIGGFVIMKGYIQRGMNGKLKEEGTSFAYGRQYDPQKTIECAFDDVSNQWYDSNCLNFYSNQNGCNAKGPTYCADGSSCGAVTAGECADTSACGTQSCQVGIIRTTCASSTSLSYCSQMN